MTGKKGYLGVWFALVAIVMIGCGGEEDAGEPGPLPSGLPARVLDLVAVSATSASITVRWSAPDLEEGGGPVTAYDLRAIAFGQEETPFPQWIAAGGVTAPATPGTVQQATLDGLESGHSYVVRLRSTADGAEWSQLSNVVVASADPRLDLTAPAAVVDLALRWRSGSRLEVEWSVTGDDGVYGAATIYDVRYAEQEITSANWDSALPTGAATAGLVAGRMQAVAEGLDPDASYHVAVRATDDAANVSGVSPSIVAVPHEGRVWQVTVDGNGDAPTISAALTQAVAGDLVLVGPGRYTWASESGGMDQHGMFYFDRDVKEIQLISEDGPQATILDAQGQGRVIYGMAHNDGVVVDGFTITGGVPSAMPEDVYAGGLTFHLTNMVVRNCIFTGNTAPLGGAIWFGGRGHPLIENCVITGNVATASGGGIYLINSPGQGGEAFDAPTVRGCVITDNQAGDIGGGVLAVDIVFHLEDCVIAGNTAARLGGGVCVLGHGIPEDPGVAGEILRCTIAGNSAPAGAGVYLAVTHFSGHPGNLDLRSSIVADNLGGLPMIMTDTCIMNIGCCDLAGNAGGDVWPAAATQEGGNFQLEPRFCDPAARDFGLSAASPCAPGGHPQGSACGQIGARPVTCGG